MNVFLARRSVDCPPAGSRVVAHFRLGLATFPHLADHGLRGLPILPGAVFLEMACCLQVDCFHGTLGRMSGVEFLEPILLPEGDISIRVEAVQLGGGKVQYSFREESETGIGGTTCAVLEIEGAAGSAPAASRLAPAAFLAAGTDLGDPGVLYSRLRENGNTYGPRFQGLGQVWQMADEALGRLRPPPAPDPAGSHHLDPVTVDSAVQLLAILSLERDRTFVLKRIGEVIWRGAAAPGPGWARVRRRPESDRCAGDVTADIDLCDDAGICWLELRGVTAALLERETASRDPGPEASDIVIASTFTAEPVADALEFWGDYFSSPVRPQFAPYGQVFQELLTPGSRFHRTRNGCNAILLNLTDWASGSNSRLAGAVRERSAEWRGLPRHVLPNGLEVAHLNRHETEYVYREIFEDGCYLRHGIELPSRGTVLDIGANIGLFSLFVRERCPETSVYAFEPSPVAFRALQANCSAYGPGLQAFNYGVSERRGSAELAFYDQSSVFSSFHPDAVEDRRAIRAVVANSVRAGLRETDAADDYVDEFLADRMKESRFVCPLVSVSDIIREQGLSQVDLLKVDAEKCELEILRGIEPGHWPLISQVVIEVHDRTRRALDEVQAILALQGFHCAVEEETGLAGSGLFNVYATRRPGAPAAPVRPALAAGVDATVDGFLQAAAEFARTAAVPTIVCLCPWEESGARGVALAASEERLARGLRLLAGVTVITQRDVMTRYPAPAFYNSPAEDDGHLPYTPEGYAALGSALFRALRALRAPPYKVLALDCDHTLWSGVCGEAGPLGVVVTPAHRRFQEFVLRQIEAGMLLCLCSKNREADVWAVFERNPGMVLTRAHLAAARINWRPKSENLRALAAELNVGVDSLILLDDNPVECAEVRASLPEALAVRLPPEPERWPAFLDHLWAFDRATATDEDARRTQMLREGVARESYRGEAPSLREFIAGLGLEVAVDDCGSPQMSRAAQLTLRTNQFNFTTVRRAEADLRRFVEAEGGRALVVGVRDRFGDYGLVGLLLYRVQGGRCLVDTFLLSCRVLGRGVEHRVCAELGRRAAREGCAEVELTFRPTDRNQPARDFILEVGAAYRQPGAGDMRFVFPAQKLAGVKLEFADDALQADRTPAAESLALNESNGRPGWAGTVRLRSPQAPSPTLRYVARADRLARIAEELAGIGPIRAAIEARTMAGAAAEAPPDTLAGKLLGLWRRTLRNPRIGFDDNFLDVGGTSLNAAQIAAEMRRELGQRVSIVTFFECPTVRAMAAKLSRNESLATSAAGADGTNEAAVRGERRNQRLRRRATTATNPA